MRNRTGQILSAILVVLLSGVGARAWQQNARLDDKSVVISVPTEGEIYLGQERLPLNEVAGRVREVLKGRPPAEQTVYIKASRGLAYGYVVSIIDRLREAGIEQIGLVAESDKEARRDADRNARPQDQRPASPSQQQPPNEADAEGPLVVKVTLTAKGLLRIKLNERAVRLANLEAAARRRLANRQDKTVTVLAPQRASYAEVVRIVDALKGAGASPIGLQLDYLQ